MEMFEFKNDDGIITERFEGRNDDGLIIKDGFYESWYNSGIKESNGEYLENYRFGIWTYWDMDGNLIRKVEYIQDKEIFDWLKYEYTKQTEVKIKADTQEEIEIKTAPNIEQSIVKPIEFGKKTGKLIYNMGRLYKLNLREKKPALLQNSEERYSDGNNFFANLNPLYYIIAVLSIILIILLITVIPGRRGIDTNAENNDKQQLLITDTISLIKNKFTDWINYTNNKNIDSLINMYAEVVNYYKQDQTKKETVKADKLDFFRKYYSLKIDVSNVDIQIENKIRYNCTYDKSYMMQELNGKKIVGKLKSRLVFQNINGKFLIVTEKDDKKIN